MLGLYKLQDKTMLCYIHTLQSPVPSVDVLGMFKLTGIILCYVHTLQSQIPFTHVLGLGKFQYKIVSHTLCHAISSS